MNALISCERFGIVRDEFQKQGWNAWSCDLVPSENGGQHLMMDARKAVHLKSWDIVIAHPPCTRLCNSGVRWLRERNLWTEMKEAAQFFSYFLHLDIPTCIENPIPHKYAVAEIGCQYDQLIQPFQFGHGEMKATCLWLKKLPLLVPTRNVTGRNQRIWKMSPSKDRGIRRSKTYRGIARAMAVQWTQYLKEESCQSN